jgi:hypothetical protein
MAISIVNGFFCASPCDVSKAKRGEDPHPSVHAGDADTPGANGSSLDRAAVRFGGSLSDLPTSARVNAPGDVSAATTSQGRQPSIDILA